MDILFSFYTKGQLVAVAVIFAVCLVYHIVNLVQGD